MAFSSTLLIQCQMILNKNICCIYKNIRLIVGDLYCLKTIIISINKTGNFTWNIKFMFNLTPILTHN